MDSTEEIELAAPATAAELAEINDEPESAELPVPDFVTALIESEPPSTLTPEQEQQRPRALSTSQYSRLVAELGDIKTRREAVKMAKAKLKDLEHALEAREQALAWYSAALMDETARRLEALKKRRAQAPKSFDLDVGYDPLLPNLPSTYRVQTTRVKDLKRRVEVVDWSAFKSSKEATAGGCVRVKLVFSDLSLEMAERLDRFTRMALKEPHGFDRTETLDKNRLLPFLKEATDPETGEVSWIVPAGVRVNPAWDEVDIRIVRAKADEALAAGDDQEAAE